jgi:hypothetical protein
MNVVIGVLIRHFLGAVGATGIASDDEIKQVVGAIVTLTMIGLSLYSTRKEIKAEK